MELKQGSDRVGLCKRLTFNRTNSGIETTVSAGAKKIYATLLIEPIVELKPIRDFEGMQLARLLIEPIVELKHDDW